MSVRSMDPSFLDEQDRRDDDLLKRRLSDGDGRRRQRAKRMKKAEFAASRVNDCCELIDQFQLRNVSDADLVAEEKMAGYSLLDMSKFSRRDGFIDFFKTVVGDGPLAQLVNDTNFKVGLMIAAGEIVSEQPAKHQKKKGKQRARSTSLGYVKKQLDVDELVDFIAIYLASAVGRSNELDDLMSQHRFAFLRAHLQLHDIDKWIESVNANLLSLVFVTGVACVDDMLVRYLGRSDVKVFIPRKPAREGILGHGLATYLRHTTLPFLVQYVGCTSRQSKMTAGDAAFKMARTLRLKSQWPIFVLDSGYGTFDLLLRLTLNGNRVISAFSTINLKGLGALLTAGLSLGQWRVFKGNYRGMAFLAYGWSTGDAKRDLLSVSTVYRVERDEGSDDGSSSESNSAAAPHAFTPRDITLLSRLSTTALKDLAVRLDERAEGNAAVLAYRIAQYTEPEHGAGGSGPGNGAGNGGGNGSSAVPSAAPPETFNFSHFKVDSSDRLESLSVGASVLVYFEDSKEVHRGTVKREDKSWPDPYGVKFPGERELCWISLDEGVALLDAADNIVACTPDVKEILDEAADDDGNVAESNDESRESLDEATLRARLQKKKRDQLLQLLSQMGVAPKHKERSKPALIDRYVRAWKEKGAGGASPAERLENFLRLSGSGDQPPMHHDYRTYMPLIDHIDQGHAQTHVNHRVRGGSDRSFMFHLLEFLFLNARAAWEDTHGNGLLHQPKSVEHYINVLIDACIARRKK